MTWILEISHLVSRCVVICFYFKYKQLTSGSQVLVQGSPCGPEINLKGSQKQEKMKLLHKVIFFLLHYLLFYSCKMLSIFNSSGQWKSYKWSSLKRKKSCALLAVLIKQLVTNAMLMYFSLVIGCCHHLLKRGFVSVILHTYPLLRQFKVMSVVVTFTGAQREMHQMPQMGPREHRQRVSSLWAVWSHCQLRGFRGSSR